MTSDQKPVTGFEYAGKAVAVVGFGTEGRSALRYFQERGAKVTIVDQATLLKDLPEGVPTILGADALDRLDGFDLISRTPSINPASLPASVKTTSVTKEFFEHCPAPIIGVTGTNGKGTTTTLIADILNAAGITAHLVGNIGTSALDVLDAIKADDVVCYEMSSFQLWDLEVSPHVAIVLMIEREHQDRHGTMEAYVAAKANIARWQRPEDLIIVHPSNEWSQHIAGQSVARKREYMKDSGAFNRGGFIEIDEHKICSLRNIKLIGDHNLENITAAITAAWEFTQDTAAIAQAVTSFKGLEHRLEFVREVDGVAYYDDSYAVSPMAATAATQALGVRGIMIYGGQSRGADYCAIAQAAKQTTPKRAVLIGETTPELKKCFEDAGLEDIVTTVDGTMEEIVNAARQFAERGDAVVLSPGTASFDMFDNYKVRGQLFKEAVHKL